MTLADWHERLLPGESWARWRRIIAATEGRADVHPDDASLFGLDGPRRLEPPREVWAIAGRGSGKSTVGAMLAVLELLRERPVAPGEKLVSMLIGRDLRQAQIIASYAASVVERLGLPLVARAATRIDVTPDRRIECMPCHAGAVRGRSTVAVVLDEAAFYVHESTMELMDAEVVRALRPRLLAHRGRLWVLSSPWMRAGMVWETHRDRFGAPDRDIAVIQAPTMALNSTFDAPEIERAIAADPMANRSEWEAEFRPSSSGYLRHEALGSMMER